MYFDEEKAFLNSSLSSYINKTELKEEKAGKKVAKIINEYENDHASLLDEIALRENENEMKIEKSISLKKSKVFNDFYIIKEESWFKLTLKYEDDVIGFEKIVVGDNAKGEINIVYENGKNIYLSRHIFLKNNCFVKINVFGKNENFLENRNIITFIGINAQCYENVALINIKGQCRFYTQLNHKEVGNKSISTVHIAAFNDSSSSIEGLIKIFEHAKNSDALLIQKTLLCSDEARVYSYPSLEIKNNEVKATHSSAISKIDEEEIFYLRCRGLSYKEAYKECVISFLKSSVHKKITKKHEKILENII